MSADFFAARAGHSILRGGKRDGDAGLDVGLSLGGPLSFLEQGISVGSDLQKPKDIKDGLICSGGLVKGDRTISPPKLNFREDGIINLSTDSDESCEILSVVRPAPRESPKSQYTGFHVSRPNGSFVCPEGAAIAEENISLCRKSKPKIFVELEESKKESDEESGSSFNPSEVSKERPNGRKRDRYGREHLFEKAVTPSDVGKLNRLVIPKLHAQRCFPLDLANREKGVHLSFEDPEGKSWRFRYSCRNGSDTYVLSKGWSNYVKSTQLKEGDIVTFERSTGGSRQLYISFHRRPCDAVTRARKPSSPIWLSFPEPFINQWTAGFTSSPTNQRPSVFSDSSSDSFNTGRWYPSNKPAAPELSHLAQEALNSSSSSSPPCTVRVFGVNLSATSSNGNHVLSSAKRKAEMLENSKFMR